MNRLERSVLVHAPRSEHFALGVAAIFVGLAVGWYAFALTESALLMYVLLAGTLCYAAAIGLTFASGRGFMIVTALTCAVVVASSLGLDDFERQWADGAFWLIGGTVVYYVVILAAWGIGGLVQVVWRAVVRTRTGTKAR